MRVYLVRHGETELNRQGCYYGRTDVSLTAGGRQQAKELADFFEKISLDRVICSPLKRAVSTAELILPDRFQHLDTDDRLAEQDFGLFEGRTYEQLKQQYPAELEAWQKDYHGYRIPQGESFLDVRNRVEDFLEELCKGQSTRVLLVAHKGTFGHLLAAALHLPPEGYWNFTVEQGCYSCVDFEDGYAILRKLNQKG